MNDDGEQTALSDKVSEAVLHVPEHDGREIKSRSSLEGMANPGFSLRTQSVISMPLDDIQIPEGMIDVIKIDVEGHERSVINGAQRVISQYKPTLIVEIEERHHPGQTLQIFEKIEQLGCRGYFLSEGSLRSIDHFDVERDQNPMHAKLVDTATKFQKYINNFIFVGRKTVLDRLRGSEL